MTEKLYLSFKQIAQKMVYKRKLSRQYRVWAAETPQEPKMARKIQALFASDQFMKLIMNVSGSVRPLRPACHEWLCFHRGDYLALHSDSTQRRKLQAVFYLNPNWSSDEGGLLEFIDARSKTLIIPPISPQGNRLVLFTIDQSYLHRVTPVTGDSPRYSLSLSYA